MPLGWTLAWPLAWPLVGRWHGSVLVLDLALGWPWLALGLTLGLALTDLWHAPLAWPLVWQWMAFGIECLPELAPFLESQL